MKKIFFLTAFMIFSMIVQSQSLKKELGRAIEEIEKGKRTMIANFIEVNENDVFWTIYEEFEKERQIFAKKQYELLVDYVDNYANYSEERMERIMDETIANRNNIEKLRLKYIKKIRKECGSKVATQFWMVQRYFESTLSSRILGELPIPEN